ncbi:4'-phosphopantetheinyl transferase superfamily [Umbelopsis sp. PMI_123]|nr:4'-phosphopantetheinyl transferase superfamily [Umbelopsis sp. PMI_123]
MLLGIGVDIVHLPRIAKILTRRHSNCQLLCRRILSPKEQVDFQARFPNATNQGPSGPDPDMVRFLATRWSIKEAIYKAMYPQRKLTWKEITIDREDGGGTDTNSQINYTNGLALL